MAVLCFSFLTVCVCAGTETELMLRDHVMPLLRGHASLCLSAFPTTPIMHLPPAVNTKDRTDAVSSGMGCRKEGQERVVAH